jgi:chromosome segregation ATPase
MNSDDTTQAKRADVDDQLEDILLIVEDLRRQLKNCKQMNATLRSELDASKERLSESEGQAGSQARDLERTRRLLAACRDENETLIAEAVSVHEDGQEAVLEIRRLRQEAKSANERLVSLEQDKDRLTRVAAEVAQKAEARDELLRNRIQELEEELEKQARKLETQTRELRRVQATVADQTREKAELEAQIANLERFRAAMGRVYGKLKSTDEGAE